jgi:hypothetical protein
MIIGVYGEDGISLEEILEINDKTYRARIKDHYELYLNPDFSSAITKYVIKRNGLHYLTEKYRKINKYCIPVWKEEIESMIDNPESI